MVNSLGSAISAKTGLQNDLDSKIGERGEVFMVMELACL